MWLHVATARLALAWGATMILVSIFLSRNYRDEILGVNVLGDSRLCAAIQLSFHGNLSQVHADELHVVFVLIVVTTLTGDQWLLVAFQVPQRYTLHYLVSASASILCLVSVMTSTNKSVGSCHYYRRFSKPDSFVAMRTARTGAFDTLISRLHPISVFSRS